MLRRARLWAPISRGSHSALDRQVLKSWQAQYFVYVGLRLRGRGSIWELSKGLGCCRARGCGPPSCVALAALWRCKRETAVHLGLRLRGRGSIWELSKGLGDVHQVVIMQTETIGEWSALWHVPVAIEAVASFVAYWQFILDCQKGQNALLSGRRASASAQ